MKSPLIWGAEGAAFDRFVSKQIEISPHIDVIKESNDPTQQKSGLVES
jgi:hypothetical protein